MKHYLNLLKVSRLLQIVHLLQNETKPNEVTAEETTAKEEARLRAVTSAFRRAQALAVLGPALALGVAKLDR